MDKVWFGLMAKIKKAMGDLENASEERLCGIRDAIVTAIEDQNNSTLDTFMESAAKKLKKI